MAASHTETKTDQGVGNKRENEKNTTEDDINKESLMYQNLQKQKLTEDYGMKCHIIKNATEVIVHQEHSINNIEQLEENSSHCEGIENQEQDESYSEVLEHSGQRASNGKRLDYPEKTQSVSEEMEHPVSIPSVCEGVEHLEKDQFHSDGNHGMEVTEESPDYSKGIEHPNEYTNDEVEHHNQNLKEGKFQEQSLKYCEGMDNQKQTHSERSNSYVEKIQHLDNFGSEKNKHQNKTNDINEELNNHEESQEYELEDKEQQNEDGFNSSTLHTNGNNRENVQDNNGKETSKISKPFACPHCPRRFKINSLLVKHLPVHTKERTLNCSQCHRLYESDKSLSIHLIGYRTTEKVGPFICPHCSREFNVKYSWQRHVFDHEKEGSEYVQACHACKLCFKSNIQFRRHRFKCHRDEVMYEKSESKQLEANKRYVCPYCDKEVRKKRWKQHLRIHKEGRERSHICSHCDKTFLHKFSLERHELLHTNRARPFACHRCKRRFLIKRHLKVHTVHCLEKLKTSKSSESIRHECPTCKRGYSTDKTLENHMKVHKVRKREYLCSVCSKGFFHNHSKTRHELFFHKSISTVKKNSYRCHTCGKYFISQKNLHRHKIIVHTKTNYGCNVCQRKFISEDELKKHEVNHDLIHMIASNTCTECKTEFDSGDALKEHCLVHIKEQVEELNSLEKKSFVCTQCNSNFESQAELMEHNVIHDKGKTACRVKKKTDQTTLVCTQCNMHFKSKSALKRHERNHKKHTQKINGNIGKSKVILNGETSKKNSKMTTKKASGGKHPFYCSICQKTFTQKGNLTRHMKLHSGERKMFTCHISTCQKTFTHSLYLTRHMKLHSGDKKMFTCHICDKKFSTKINLEAHLRSHTDIEEAYLCSECLKIFASRASLKDHIEAVHAKEKLYPCPLCPMKFAYKNIMQKHFLSHRGEEVLSCPHCPKYYESQEDMNWHIIRSHRDIVHKFSYKDEFYYNLRILEEDPKNIDKKEPESTTNIKSKMEKINQNTLKMRKKKCKQIVDKQETGLGNNKNPVESEGLRNVSIDNENSLQECSVMFKYQYTYSGIDDKSHTLWL